MAFAFKPAVTFGTGENIYAIIALCRRMAKVAGMHADQIEDFTNKAIATESYDAALEVIRDWFDVKEKD